MQPQNAARATPAIAGRDPQVDRLGGAIEQAPTTSPNQRATIEQERIPLPRIQYLARRIHQLGERPLFELLKELDAGGNLPSVLERYARIAPLADFISSLDGDRLAAPLLVTGGR
jgi:hypothetical protein